MRGPCSRNCTARHFDRFPVAAPLERPRGQDAPCQVCVEEAQIASVHRPVGEIDWCAALVLERFGARAIRGFPKQPVASRAQRHIRHLAPVGRPCRRVRRLSRLVGRDLRGGAGRDVDHPHVARFLVEITFDHDHSLPIRGKDWPIVQGPRSDPAHLFALAIEEGELAGVGLENLRDDLRSFDRVTRKRLGIARTGSQQQGSEQRKAGGYSWC